MRDLTRHYADSARASLALASYTDDDDERDALDVAADLRAERHGLHVEEIDETD